MKLTNRDKVTLIAAFGGVLLAALIGIGIREWYAPDLRYEYGGYYLSGKTQAIASLKIKNYGHSDAEDIILSVKFNKNVIDMSTNDEATPIVSTGIGTTNVIGKIHRLVPNQEVFVYFAIETPLQQIFDLPKEFLSSIVYKGGMGKTGQPPWGRIAFVVLSILVNGLLIFLSYRLTNTQVLRHRKKLGEVIEIATLAAVQGMPKENFEARIDEFIKKVRFRKATLQLVALKVFETTRNCHIFACQVVR